VPQWAEKLDQNWVAYAWDAVGVVLIWVAARILTSVSARFVTTSYKKRAAKLSPERQRRAETAATVSKSLLKYVIFFLAIAATIGQLGLTSAMSSLLAAAGVGGIALGIGAQSFIKDVVAGLLLIFEDQMAVGDYVDAGGVTGIVEEITLRTTTIRGYRGEINVIPNGAIGILTNYSRADYLAMVDINITYETDIDRAGRFMREEAEAYARESGKAVDPPEVLGVTAMGGDGVTMRMILRVQPMAHWAAERALKARIKERFEREGIEFPYPRMRVLAQGPGPEAEKNR